MAKIRTLKVAIQYVENEWAEREGGACGPWWVCHGSDECHVPADDKETELLNKAQRRIFADAKPGRIAQAHQAGP